MKSAASNPPCTLVGVNMEDPASSVRDPKLTALVSEGWEIVAHVPAERGGMTEWLLLMTPPKESTAQVDNKAIKNILYALLFIQAINLLMNFL